MARSSSALLGIVAVWLLAAVARVSAQPATCTPLGAWESPTVQWEKKLADALTARQLRANAARPPAYSMQPRPLQLLEDALLRKHPKLLGGSRVKAREVVMRRYMDKDRYGNHGQRARLRGTFAEALYLDRHPEWQYVAKPNASQHDVCLIRPGLPPLNGQVKVHVSGDASKYADDMLKDYRAHQFLVPDDHAESLRDHLRQAGRFRDANRVKPAGFTYAELEAQYASAFRSATRERYAGCISLGAALGVSVGDVAWDSLHGRIDSNVAGYRLIRAGTLAAVGLGADKSLRFACGGVLRGTLRGNALVAAAISVTDIGWLIHEHGWRQAFYEPSFYEAAVGGVSAAALGLGVGTVVAGLAAETGPWAPVIGGVAGGLASAGGYFGGAKVTRWALEAIAPEMVRKQERDRIENAKRQIER